MKFTSEDVKFMFLSTLHTWYNAWTRHADTVPGNYIFSLCYRIYSVFSSKNASLEPFITPLNHDSPINWWYTFNTKDFHFYFGTDVLSLSLIFCRNSNHKNAVRESCYIFSCLNSNTTIILSWANTLIKKSIKTMDM